MQSDSYVPISSQADAPAVLHLFGLTAAGHTALVRVHAFRTYFYAQFYPGVAPAALADALHRQLYAARLAPEGSRIGHGVELVTKRNVLHYVPGDPEMRFFKVTVSNPRLVRDVASLQQRGYLGVIGDDGAKLVLPALLTFEATLDHRLRFMMELGMCGCSWLTLPAGSYTAAADDERRSLLQYDGDVDATDVIAHRTEGEWLAAALVRRLSFDIECAGRKGVFPEPQHDSVISIANHVWEYGSDAPAAQVVFTCKSCASIVVAEVLSFEKEGDMLAAWSRFVRLTDSDIVTRCNIVNVDLPYLLDRADVLEEKGFPFLGRTKGQVRRMRKTKMSSSAFGTHESRAFTMHGRVIFGMLQLISREYKLRSYLLNSVPAAFLGQQKEDV